MINIQEEKFLKINIITIIAVSGFYGVIKFFSAMIPIAIGIFIALVVLVVIFMVLYKMNISFYIRALLITIVQLSLIFFISTSGDALYDDYILYMASAAMAGVYFTPSYIIVQVILIDSFLAYNFLLNPEKLGEMSQAVLCIVCLQVALAVLCVLIKRGQSYIKDAQNKSQKTAELLQIILQTQTKLQLSFSNTYTEINNMTQISAVVKESGENLLQGNTNIFENVQQTDQIVNEMFSYIEHCVSASQNINVLINESNLTVETNKQRLDIMSIQLEKANHSVNNISSQIDLLDKTISKIESVSKENQNIAVQTNILAINATIEAAHAGTHGAGFAIVAEEVRLLASNSNKCSENVSVEIQKLNNIIIDTKKQSNESIETMNLCNQNLIQLEDSFTHLKECFVDVDSTVSGQNNAISQIFSTCTQLVQNTKSMDVSSENNKADANRLFSKIIQYTNSVNSLKENANTVKELTENISETIKDN